MGKKVKKRDEKLTQIVANLPNWLIDRLDKEANDLELSRNEIMRRIMCTAFDMQDGELIKSMEGLFDNDTLDEMAKKMAKNIAKHM